MQPWLTIFTLCGLPFTIGYVIQNRKNKGAVIGSLLMFAVALALPFVFAPFMP